MKQLAYIGAFTLMCLHSTILSAETWDTTWGSVSVRVDSNNRFIAYYSDSEDGIIVMSPNGDYYDGWWARTGNCNCPETATTRSGYATSCYGFISGYLETEYSFRGSWVDCYQSNGGPWNGLLR